MHTFLFYLNVACSLLNLWIAMAVYHAGVGAPWVNMGLAGLCLWGAWRSQKQAEICLTEPCVICKKKDRP